MAFPGHTGGLGTEHDFQVTDGDLDHGVCVQLQFHGAAYFQSFVSDPLLDFVMIYFPLPYHMRTGAITDCFNPAPFSCGVAVDPPAVGVCTGLAETVWA